MNRRRFLATTGMALAAPTILSSSAAAQGKTVAPSERITMGIVGWGMMGPSNTGAFLGNKDCQIVAACDLDKNHLQQALDKINGHYRNKDCKPYHDFHEMMARKDIYGEKPLARTIAEQQAIVRAVQKHKRIWQTGSWQRSKSNFRKGAEIVRNGLIGKVTRVEVGLPAGHTDFAHTAPALVAKLAQLPDKPADPDPAKIVPGTPAWDVAVSEPPPELDYEMWIGPSRMEPYISARIHMNWRWNYNTGGGQLLDWIGHHCDIAHWGLGFDNNGPSEIEGHGEFPPPNALWNTCKTYRIELKYPDDITMIIASVRPEIKGGTKWIGTDGWVWVDREKFDASNIDWFSESSEKRKVQLYVSEDHHRNFLDCVKSRKPTITPVETAHHSAIPGHLGLISMLVGRKIKWDVAKEKILGDAEASKLLSRPYRKPWKLG